MRRCPGPYMYGPAGSCMHDPEHKCQKLKSRLGDQPLLGALLAVVVPATLRAYRWRTTD